jgi:hypothetical protein
MDIWHLENKDYTRLLLWRIDCNNFRLTIRDEFKPLLTNIDYTLLDKKYTSLLNSLSDQITLNDAKIYDLNLKVEIDNYTELKIHNTINPSSINSIDSNGLKIWSFDGEVFVSGELKESLLKINNFDFVFTLGFSNFG